MELYEIKKNKQNGDLVTASKIVGINQANATAALNKPGSKHHAAVIKALTAIITTREQLIAAD